MNSKQRRKEKRRALRMGKFFTGMLLDLLGDLESGETTIKESREGINKLKSSLDNI